MSLSRLLHTVFRDVCTRYTSDENLVQELWNEIERTYSAPARHYHTLQHLEHMLRELEYIKDHTGDYDAMLFALFYHDFVYKTTRTDNEAQSALKATERLVRLGVPESCRERSRRMILASATHAIQPDPDINLFTDADLSILGSSPERYKMYTKQVRKEYAAYPGFIYKKGRKKILEHFLQMESLYKTDHFRALYEETARKNIAYEKELLS